MQGAHIRKMRVASRASEGPVRTCYRTGDLRAHAHYAGCAIRDDGTNCPLPYNAWTICVRLGGENANERAEQALHGGWPRYPDGQPFAPLLDAICHGESAR